MIPIEIGQKLHNQSTRGEPLTSAEQESLRQWYDDLDRQEAMQLNATCAPERSAELQSRVQHVTAQIVAQARRIEALTAENVRLGQEVAALQHLLAGPRASQPV